MTDLLWPAYDGPDDLAAIEAVPLADRGRSGAAAQDVTLPARCGSFQPGRTKWQV
jgi:hypothetical protein